MTGNGSSIETSWGTKPTGTSRAGMGMGMGRIGDGKPRHGRAQVALPYRCEVTAGHRAEGTSKRPITSVGYS